MPGHSAKLAAISAQQLSGRSQDHVVDDPLLGCRMHPAAAAALRQLRQVAAQAGIELRVTSAYRSFDQQLRIWNAKYAGQRPMLDAECRPLDPACLNDSQRVDAILLWSALPGASRHHWGSDCDVIDAAALAPGEKFELVPAEYRPGGRFARLGAWLDEHVERFGFFRPYDRDRGGVQPEPWHLSYAPLARRALADSTVELLRETIAGADIRGRDSLLERLPELHARYVLAVAEPDARALSAALA